ncbi:uncharacterized protein [Epargyreus clarus]|uniref:uncharacterized protein n=1 Tax=Epargyreus clarus TaxID=520877 RepID=UPI003C2E870E
MLALTGHFIEEEEFNLKSLLLDCVPLLESHTAKNIAECIKQICEEWGISNKILLAVSDNGANIKCAIERELGWKHFSCYTHTLNLSVNDTLKEKNIEELVSKIKGIVRHFKQSNFAWEKLKKFQVQAGATPKRLLQEVPTRWNLYVLHDKTMCRAKGTTKQCNAQDSRHNANLPQLQEEDPTPAPTTSSQTKSIWQDFEEKMQGIQPEGTAQSRAIVEVQRYYDDKIIARTDCPLKWWRDHRSIYPNLYKIAATKLNAMASSVPCERVFSAAGNILNERRTRLGTRKLQQLLFLQQNSL